MLLNPANEWNQYFKQFSTSTRGKERAKTGPARSHGLLACCLYSFSIWHPAQHTQIELTAWSVKVNSLPLVRNSFTQYYFRWLEVDEPKREGKKCCTVPGSTFKRSIRVYRNLTSACCNLNMSWRVSYTKQYLAKLRVTTCFQCGYPPIPAIQMVFLNFSALNHVKKSHLNNHKLVPLQRFGAAFCPIHTFLKLHPSTCFLPLGP